MAANIGWVDATMGALLLLSIAVGLVRGLVFELLSLLGWFVAFIASQALAPLLAPHLPVGDPGSGARLIAAYLLCFVVVLIVWSLGARLLRRLIRATPLSPVDRFLGAGFGLARGLIVLLLVTTFVGLTPLRRTPAWQASQGVVWLQAALRGLEPVLPAELAPYLFPGTRA